MLTGALVTGVVPGPGPVAAAPADAGPATFSNTTSITMPALDKAAPYPSTIAVSGLTGGITDLTVTLTDIDHMYPDRLQAVLVAPNGDALLLTDRAGGTNPLNDVTLTLSDSAGGFLPDGAWSTGTYKPSTYYTGGTHTLPAPGPGYQKPGPTEGSATLTSVFGGDSPNGTWSLYVTDWGGGGSITGGWSLAIGTPDSTPPQTSFTTSPAGGKSTSLTVPFAFTSDEPGSTFACSLDGAEFTACTSPTTRVVAPGVHSFQVRATDAALNTDPTPAISSFTAYDCAALGAKVLAAKRKVKLVSLALKAAKAAHALAVAQDKDAQAATLAAKIKKLRKKLKKAKAVFADAKAAAAPCAT
jgi:subtilisin-like proprotein convertase family protein